MRDRRGRRAPVPRRRRLRLGLHLPARLRRAHDVRPRVHQRRRLPHLQAVHLLRLSLTSTLTLTLTREPCDSRRVVALPPGKLAWAIGTFAKGAAKNAVSGAMPAVAAILARRSWSRG